MAQVDIIGDCIFFKKLVAILKYDTKNTQNKRIELVKVQRSEDPKDTTLELQVLMEGFYQE